MNIINREIWKAFLCKDSNKFSSQKIYRIDENIKEYILRETNFFSEETPLLVRLISMRDGFSNLHQPTCGFCGKLMNKVYDGKIKRFCGSKCYSQTEEFKNNLKCVDHHKANTKRKKTMKEKYGIEFNSQRKEIHHIWKKSKLEGVNDKSLFILSSKELMIDLHINQKKSSLEISQELNVYYGTVKDWIEKHGITYQYYRNDSQYERRIQSWLTDHNIHYDVNDRTIISPKELDIFIPSNKLAIEINGHYWHGAKNIGEIKEARFRHQIKSLLCKERGIQLIHLSDLDVKTKFKKITDKLSFHLFDGERIGARSCYINEIDHLTAMYFCNNYHFDGYSNSSIKLGLFHGNELVSVMTFSKARFDLANWEIIRSCSSKKVIGGVSKLINHFIKYFMKPTETLITYVDIGNGFSGLSYQKAGMELKRITEPGYIWIDKEGNQFSRYQMQTKKLKNLFNDFTESDKEDDFLFRKKMIKYYDSGNFVYSLHKA